MPEIASEEEILPQPAWIGLRHVPYDLVVGRCEFCRETSVKCVVFVNELGLVGDGSSERGG